MKEKRKIKLGALDGPLEVDFEVEAERGVVRVSLGVWKVALGLVGTISVESAREVATMLLDAARDAAGESGEGEGEGVSP